MTTPEDMALDPAWGASHMIHERDADLIEKGSAITRAVHDLHNPAKRNPSNEIECSDHYARAMASYGVFLAAGLPGSLHLCRRLGHLQPETGERFSMTTEIALKYGHLQSCRHWSCWCRRECFVRSQSGRGGMS